MNKNSIVKISSSQGKGLGTGFVIDQDDDGVFIATCGHVVHICNGLLINNREAVVVENYYEEGLDIAILYLKNVSIPPMILQSNVEPKRVKVEGFTYFGGDIKRESMFNIEAKYGVEIEKRNRSVEIIRLTPKERITKGYSGSPVICESTGVVVGMVSVESQESHTNYAISIKHIFEVYNLALFSFSDRAFIEEALSALDSNRLVVLFSQDFIDITHHQNSLKSKMIEKFREGFAHFSVPAFLEDSQEYFKILAKSCCLSETIDNPHSWKVAMQSKLQDTPQQRVLFITDIEEGNIVLDKQLALIVRSLVSEFSNFLALFIGKKGLASLVYGESSLSPLNTAKELFFPNSMEDIDDSLIERQFLSLGKYREELCLYLKKDLLGRHKAWSFNEAINALFWKNLLIKKGNDFVWRSVQTKKIGRAVLECQGGGL